MGKLYWESKAYDEAGNLVMQVHNVEMSHLLQLAEEQRKANKDRPKDKQKEVPRQTPLVVLATQNELFDMNIMEGLTEEAVKVIWGVMPGDMRLKKPLTEEEKQAERAAFKQMLIEAQERLYWKGRTTDGVAERHNDKLMGGKSSTGKTKRTKKGIKKDKPVGEVAPNFSLDDLI